MKLFIARVFYVLFFFSSLSIFAQFDESSEGSNEIRLNQIGFYPEGPKVAVIVDKNATDFELLTAEGRKRVFEGELSNAEKWPHSNEIVKQANFSSFSKEGEYILYVPGVGYSHPFRIGEDVHFESAKASLKAYYFQRASTALPEEYAGKWTREAGHPDTAVKIHNSAATVGRPAGSTISSPKGWYDAGDYGKYIVNSGITMGTLLSLYEDFPEYIKDLDLNIPESGNDLPDLLDETLWNLRWMMTMQDGDGGVYHKLTSKDFHPAVAPKEADYQRWVVQKSTPATLDFAAVAAQAARIYDDFEEELPGLSDSLLVMSKKAYSWAEKNPNVAYVQRELKDPEVATGAYGDRNFKDELQWAATELFITTGKEKYYEDAEIKASLDTSFDIPAWPNVNTLALYSLMRNSNEYGNEEVVDTDAIAKKIMKMADELVDYSQTSPYGTPMGAEESDFEWGSNSVAGNQGVLLLYAYRITGKDKYLNAAINNLDYLLGRNATSYSFLTGYGEKSTRDPHHRPSEGDTVEDPVPGLLAGGPNPGQQDIDSCMDVYTEEHQYPATSYIDNRCSYASNEIAINWNAPFAYLANAIEAIKEERN